MPKGFKLAPKNLISDEIKAKNKGVFISPYSTEYDNILVVGPIAGKKHQELIFPVVSPDPEKDSDVKYLTYPLYAGGNRGRGQVYPTGEKSNVNIFGATQAGQIAEVKTSEKGESNVTIVNSDGNKISQTVPTGLTLTVKEGVPPSKIIAEPSLWALVVSLMDIGAITKPVIPSMKWKTGWIRQARNMEMNRVEGVISLMP